MNGWWRRRSRGTRRRLVFYPGLLALAGGFLVFTMVMPGRSHHGALPALGPEGEVLAERLRADVTLLVGQDAERSQRTKGSLERSATLLEAALREEGLVVQRLPYVSDGVTVVNVEATLDGGAKAREIVSFLALTIITLLSERCRWRCRRRHGNRPHDALKL